jgi:hypothetical protein
MCKFTRTCQYSLETVLPMPKNGSRTIQRTRVWDRKANVHQYLIYDSISLLCRANYHCTFSLIIYDYFKLTFKKVNAWSKWRYLVSATSKKNIYILVAFRPFPSCFGLLSIGVPITFDKYNSPFKTLSRNLHVHEWFSSNYLLFIYMMYSGVIYFYTNSFIYIPL